MTDYITKFSSLKLFINAAFIASFLCISYVYADEFDTFNVVGTSSYTHEDNLFRLPSGLEPAQSEAKRSDNIFRKTIGFTVNKQYSLQTFRGNFDHVQTTYDNAKFLDFKANNYKGAWLWAITPHLTGVLSADRTVSLVPFQDQRDFNQSNAPVQNIRTRETQLLSFDFSPHDKWHLIGAYRKLDVENSKTFLPETSFKLDSIEGGVKYVFPSDSYISFVSRVSDGKNQEINNVRLVGKGFEEKQQELTGSWLITGKSKVTSNVGYLRRTDDNFSIRDFSGWFGGVNYLWNLSGKTAITFGVTRNLSGYSTDSDSYVINDNFLINPSWSITSKIIVLGNFQIGRRVYKGDGPAQSSLNREDDLLIYGVGINWLPRSTIRLGLNFQHNDRDTNASNLDYSANTASINGQLTF